MHSPKIQDYIYYVRHMIVINNKRKFFGLTLRQILSLIKAVQKLIDLKTSGKLINLKTSEGPLCYISD